ncbi:MULTISPECIES: GNAT family N-acetyltransferase [Enterococcus]|uniref:N-acetyltransferase domain-containing protein n=1 Tax=Candidatus Enterococcus mangumiae TaxID=2230878 RepID=A0ABZ2SXM0_9ENTE|nr:MULTISPECIES: GNAT family N-acetyltransferase [unclassified Enterococcus]MBO0461073.1 GNAT family N-acetyltransferase [Enterococcus sp. DIV1298c]MBO0490182.1 GNAT family N-acetyltransferase [Enterococcus sp. DIV1094]MBO1298841.1 GNAT family N-acetyltransferase [Enterococcus sp. DIV1271a]
MEKLTIRSIDKKDLDTASKFAAQGMNYSSYTENPIALYLYRQYALSAMLMKSTVTLGAYLDGKFVGFIFARFDGEKKVPVSWGRRLFVNMVEKMIGLTGYQGAIGAYDQANQKMYHEFASNHPEGEITYFAVDPALKGKRIGSRLLEEIKKRYKDKRVYLYTDSNCNYQFYLKKGFQIFGRQPIDLGEGEPMTCYLLSTTL